MSQDNKENFQGVDRKVTFLSFTSSKLRVGIIGGGNAGFIKAKHFIADGCYVEIIATHFTKQLLKLKEENTCRVNLIKKEFDIEFLKDKHIIVIAINNFEISKKVKDYCDDNCKIYIDCSNFLDGLGAIPCQRSTKNINFALSTKGGNPKGSIFVSNKIKNILDEYDEFIRITTIIRNNVKSNEKYKSEVFDIIYNEKFEEAIKNKQHEKYLMAKLPSDLVKSLLRK